MLVPSHSYEDEEVSIKIRRNLGKGMTNRTMCHLEWSIKTKSMNSITNILFIFAMALRFQKEMISEQGFMLQCGHK